MLALALGTPSTDEQIDFVDRSREADAAVETLLNDASNGRRDTASLAAVKAWRAYLGERDETIALILEGQRAEAIAHDRKDGEAQFTKLRAAFFDHAFKLTVAALVLAALTLQAAGLAALAGYTLSSARPPAANARVTQSFTVEGGCPVNVGNPVSFLPQRGSVRLV